MCYASFLSKSCCLCCTVNYCNESFVAYRSKKYLCNTTKSQLIRCFTCAATPVAELNTFLLTSFGYVSHLTCMNMWVISEKKNYS